MSAVLQYQSTLEQAYNRLKTSPVMSPNHNWLASMAASWCVGLSVLPDYMGLKPNQFQQLKCTYFQVDKLPEQAVSGIQLDFNRMLEKEDLVKLLTRNSRVNTLEMDWLIAMIVAGCLGNNHLWQDLGLWSRTQLTALLRYNFPELAAKNTKDMKWKKFLYKQLCEEEGLYLCRAPSCNVCIDYQKCYGSEE
jgi:nitrogen fixation protein NifQ